MLPTQLFLLTIDSLGHDIPKMLQFFREGLEYMVQDEHLIKTRIARVSCVIYGLVIFSVLSRAKVQFKTGGKLLFLSVCSPDF